MQQGLIESSLVFFGDKQQLVFIGSELVGKFPFPKAVHLGFGVLQSGLAVCESGEGDQCLDVLVVLFFEIGIEGFFVTDDVRPR